MHLNYGEKKEISYKIHRSQLCFCGLVAFNVFNFNYKFMFPVRQIQSC